MNQMDRRFASALLRRIGAPVTGQNLRFLYAWGQAEGTRARFNPLATTRYMPGATAFNSVGVRNFRSFGQGVEATARALENGLYPHILSLMRSGSANARQMAAAVAASPWGTHEGVLRVLGAGGGRAPARTTVGPSVPVAGLPRPSGGLPGAPSSAEMAAQRRQLIMGLLPAVESGNVSGVLSSLNALKALRNFKPVSPGGTVIDNKVLPPSVGTTPQVIGNWKRWVTFSSGADRPGAHTNPTVPAFVAKIASVYGRRLEIGTGTNHNQYVVGTNRQSDHWTGDAADIPMSGSALTRLGQAALIAAGANPRWARKQRGGVFNINGYQILFNTNVGGNHWNHLHVGLGRRPGSNRSR